MIYHLTNKVEASAGGFEWSETNKRRKPLNGPLKGAPRFSSIDGDCFPLGPFPDELKSKISEHWVVLGHDQEKERLPRTFNRVSSTHLSGLPAVDESTADVFCRHAQGEYELIRLEKVWSLTLARRVEEPLFLVNVFRNIQTIDMKASKVINPRVAAPYVVIPGRNKIKLSAKFNGAEGIWRDSNTSNWFCSDTFRWEIEGVTSNTYSFEEVTKQST